jgi:flagellar motor switch/type III secretory pathway protein FliN
LFPLFSGIFFDLDSTAEEVDTPAVCFIGSFYQCSSDAIRRWQGEGVLAGGRLRASCGISAILSPFQSFPVPFGTVFAIPPPRMEAPTSLPGPGTEALTNAAPSSDAETPNEAALVPSVHPRDEQEGLQLNPRLARLAVELDVAIPVRDFRVRNLLVLEPGQVIETQWQQGEDMPLTAGSVQLAWSEFEVIDSRLAVRITRLA